MHAVPDRTMNHSIGAVYRALTATLFLIAHHQYPYTNTAAPHSSRLKSGHYEICLPTCSFSQDPSQPVRLNVCNSETVG